MRQKLNPELLKASRITPQTFKTYKNLWFSMVFEVWGVILEAWRSSEFGFWHTGWQKVGWLERWLVVAGADWESGWEAAGRGDPRSREPKVR